jgi:molybdopterin molybdotransferase
VSTLLTIDEALEQVLARVSPLEAEVVPVEMAVGRVLAEDARAHIDLPPFPASAMDGFALRAADTPGTLPVVGVIAAGRPAALPLEPGEAMSIMTGGVVPDGADAVVPVELVEQDGELITTPSVVQGDNVRPRGSDLRVQEVVVRAGRRLGAAQLGALAAAGVTAVRCARAPLVAVLVTGSELRGPGEVLAPGEIYDSNGLILTTQLESAGATVTRLPPVEDHEASTRVAIEDGLAFDVLVTSGGVSVGEYDYVRAAERELGVEEVFWGVSMRPGKPTSFGLRGRTLVFGLPGNPVSSLVALELFVRPAVLALQGVADPAPPFRPGRLARAARPNGIRDSLVRARSHVDGHAVSLEPLDGQESHMIAQAATADALVFVPAGADELPAGTDVRYLSI